MDEFLNAWAMPRGTGAAICGGEFMCPVTPHLDLHPAAALGQLAVGIADAMSGRVGRRMLGVADKEQIAANPRYERIRKGLMTDIRRPAGSNLIYPEPENRQLLQREPSCP